MTGKLGVGEDSMTTMVMCARPPFFLTTAIRHPISLVLAYELPPPVELFSLPLVGVARHRNRAARTTST